MAIKINKSENKLLNLPGRMSCEIVAGSAVGSNISVRVVEIPAGVQKSKRSLHYHPNTDECIYVLEGTGRTETINKSFDLQEGDSIIVSAGEKHRTLNSGNKILKLICFFPSDEIETCDDEAIS